MRMMLLSALALGALTTAALAKPVELTETQMDRVTAGNHGEPHGSGGTFEDPGPTASSEGAGGGGSGLQGGGSGGTITRYHTGTLVETCSGGGGGGVGGGGGRINCR